MLWVGRAMGGPEAGGNMRRLSLMTCTTKQAPSAISHAMTGKEEQQPVGR